MAKGVTKLLVANRGEIAIRIMRASRDIGIESVAVAPEDDLGSLHTRVGDAVVTLPGRGAAAPSRRRWWSPGSIPTGGRSRSAVSSGAASGSASCG